jgi:hypothetical protein
MPKGKGESTELDLAWDDAAECLRAYRKRPSMSNRDAVCAALDTYRDEYLRDFERDGGSAREPKLKAVS